MGLEPEHGEEGRPVKAGELAEGMDYSWTAETMPGAIRAWAGSSRRRPQPATIRGVGGLSTTSTAGWAALAAAPTLKIDVSEYKNMVGGWMKTLLEAEGQAPGKMVLGILKHPVGRMTREKWTGCLAGEVGPADEAEASEDDLARAAAPLALSDSECSQDEADDVPELAPKRRRLCGKQPRPFAFLERFVGPGLAAAAALARGLGPLRRPAARAAYPNERCAGADGRECSFSTAALGSPAAIQPSRGQRGCLFCCDERLDSLLVQQNGFQVTKTLSALQAMSPAKFEECLENLRRRRGEAFASDFRARVLRAGKRREQKAAPKAGPAEKWKDLLAARQRPAGELGPEDAAWQETVRRDRMRIRRKVFCPGRLRCRYSEANEQEEIALAPPASDAAPNDSGLPSPDVSKRAEMAEKWCKFGSWQMCQTCRSMRPRPFWPGDLKRVAPPTVKKCGLCQRGVKVPQPGDVPKPCRARLLWPCAPWILMSASTRRSLTATGSTPP